MCYFHDQKGFTLVELLIYTALFAVVSTLLVGMLSVVTRVGGTESVTAEVASQANFVLQTIQRHVAESSLVEVAGREVGGEIFADKVEYATGSKPSSVALGDVDNDGDMDAVVANKWSFPYTVSVLLNDGQGVFAPKVDYATGHIPYGIALGDVNKDGNLDIVVASNSIAEISILLGNGDGTFGVNADYVTAGAAFSIALGDVNGDGWTDAVVPSNASPIVSVLLNSGSGTFTPKVDYAIGAAAFDVALSDLNGDTKLDIVTSNRVGGTISVLFGNGLGAFGPKTDYAVGNVPYGLALGYVNNDAKLDIAVARLADDSASVLANNGSGGFILPGDNYATQDGPYGVALSDVDGDGDADMVVTNYNDKSVSVFINNGNGIFDSQAIEYGTENNPSGVALGDINNDGSVDMIVANTGSDSVSVFIANSGSGNEKLLVYKKDYEDSVVKIEYKKNDKQIVVKEGPGQAVSLTTDKVSVDRVRFRVKHNTGASDTVQVDLTLSYVSDNPDQRLSRSFSLGIARVNAATFDSSVLRAVGSSWAIGSAAEPWANGYFTNVVVGPSGGNNLTVTGNAFVSGQLGVGASSVTSGTLLEVGSGGYFQFDKTSAGAPLSADCNAIGQRGRMVLDINNNRLYICNGSAWKYAPLQ